MSDDSPPFEDAGPNLFGDAPAAGGEGAYVVLARKYRPRRFEDLIGQEAMVRTIANSFAMGRIPHAYMLTGVRGVGKTTTARLIARALNYQTDAAAEPSIKLDPLGVHCPSIMESRHPDVFEMDAASRTGINDIREILESVRYAPVMARTKVYIIDEVHMLSSAAFNGLLKTLEEPPPHVKFVFATTEIRKVPVTVLSRCQRFDLKRIAPEALAQHLARICKTEGVEVDPNGLALIARAAEGSVRDSLSLLDQALVQNARTGAVVKSEDVRDMLGLADRDRTLDLFAAILDGHAKPALQELRAQYDRGADPGLVLRDLMEIGHEIGRAQALGKEAGIVGGADYVARIEMLSHRTSPAQISRLWQMLLKALEEVGRAPDAIAAAEMALVRLCAAAHLPPPEEAAKLLREAAAGGASGPAAPSAPAGPRMQSFEDVAALLEERREFSLKIEVERGLRVTAFQPGLIRFSPAGAVAEDLPLRLGRMLKQLTGVDWRIERDAAAPAASVESIAERRAREKQAEMEALKRQPFVAEALNAFPEAKIVRVTPPKSEQEGGGDVTPLSPPGKRTKA